MKNKFMIFAAIACMAMIACSHSDDGDGEEQTGEIQEVDPCISLSEDCPDHCYEAAGRAYDEERDCFADAEPVICSETDRDGAANAPTYYRHVESDVSYKFSGAHYEEFEDRDIWTKRDVVAGDQIDYCE